MATERTKLKINGVRCWGCDFCRNEVDHASLGHALRKKRDRAGMSQKAMAITMKFSAAFVCDLELGRRRWTARLVEQYLKALKA